jgi:hypothetical protein
MATSTTTSNNNDIAQKVDEVTTQFYTDNKKNTFFKKQQKIDCATAVVNQIGLEDLIDRTVFIFPNTNKVFLNYPLFKTFATPDNYEYVVQYILTCFQYCITNYGSYSTHVNLDTFTISAAERYKHVVEMFLNKCMSSSNEYDFSSQLTHMYIYYTPNTFQNISKLLSAFIHPTVKEKIVLYDKKESGPLMDALKMGY